MNANCSVGCPTKIENSVIGGKIGEEIKKNKNSLLQFLISSTLHSSDAQKQKQKNMLCACADFFMEHSQ